MIVASRDQARGNNTVAAIERDSGQAAFLPADLSPREGAERLAAEASRVFAPIEIMVNNAGTFSSGPTAATTEAAYDDMMDTSAKSPFFLTAALAPAMARRGRWSHPAQNGGTTPPGGASLTACRPDIANENVIGADGDADSDSR